MAAVALSNLVLKAASVTDDLGSVALADTARRSSASSRLARIADEMVS